MGYSMRAAEAFEGGNREETIKILKDGINYYSEKLLKGIGGEIEEDDMSIVLALLETVANAIRASLPWMIVSAADALKPMLYATSVKIPVIKKKREDDEK